MVIQILPAEHAARLLPLLEQVHALHVKAHPDLYSKITDKAAATAFLQGWIAQDTVTALIAGPETAPIGYLIYEIETRDASVLRAGYRRAMLHHISVDAAHQRQGIARALIQTMRAQVSAQGVTTISTIYGAFNAPSAALMRSQGLEPVQILASGPV